MIYTIGYTSLGFRIYQIIPKLRQIADEKRATIVDIRSRPYGLVNLNQLKRELGARYVWVQELGFPQYKENAERVNLPYNNIILMCAEKDYKCCHRADVAKILRNIRNDNEVIVHLNSAEVDGNTNNQKKLALGC